MPIDNIRVRGVRTAEREAEAEKKRLQRDADRNFFSQMRHLMPNEFGINILAIDRVHLLQDLFDSRWLLCNDKDAPITSQKLSFVDASFNAGNGRGS